jgi:hypothetical protein
MRERRLLVPLLLLALIVAAPLATFALAGCADDDCPPSCGDCALCGQSAVFGTLPSPIRLVAGAPSPSEVETTAPAAPTRAVEHVPLRHG